MSEFGGGSSDNLVFITQQREQLETLKRQLNERDRQILERDKKVCPLNSLFKMFCFVSRFAVYSVLSFRV